jgi:hypothetical protein
LTSTTPVVVKLLSEQRKRCLATILNAAENSPWWAGLPNSQQQVFREQVRTALAVFYDLCRDVVKVTDDDGVRNDVALDLIRAMHAQQRELVERLKP